MPEFLVSVAFRVEPVTVKVYADSLAQAWSNRDDIARLAVPESWEVVPTSIEGVDASSRNEGERNA